MPQPPSVESFDASVFWKLIAQAFALKGRSLSRFGVCVGMSYAVAVVFVIIQVVFVWLRLDVRIIFLLNVLLLVSITTLVFTYIKNVIRSCGKGGGRLCLIFVAIRSITGMIKRGVSSKPVNRRHSSRTSFMSLG